MPNDIQMAIPDDLQFSSRVLKQVIETMQDQKEAVDRKPVFEPYHFDDASWVAARWVELLDLTTLEKQRLMQLDSPILRLELIQDILETGYHKTV